MRRAPREREQLVELRVRQRLGLDAELAGVGRNPLVSGHVPAARTRVFELLGKLRRSSGTTELAGRVGLHPKEPDSAGCSIMPQGGLADGEHSLP